MALSAVSEVELTRWVAGYRERAALASVFIAKMNTRYLLAVVIVPNGGHVEELGSRKTYKGHKHCSGCNRTAIITEWWYDVNKKQKGRCLCDRETNWLWDGDCTAESTSTWR